MGAYNAEYVGHVFSWSWSTTKDEMFIRKVYCVVYRAPYRVLAKVRPTLKITNGLSLHAYLAMQLKVP